MRHYLDLQSKFDIIEIIFMVLFGIVLFIVSLLSNIDVYIDPGEQRKEQECIASGGKVIARKECQGWAFLDDCRLFSGALCESKKYRQEKQCDCGVAKCFDGNKCVSDISFPTH